MWLLAGAILAAGHAPVTAQAQSAAKATVGVHVAPCVDVDFSRFERLLFLELGTSATLQKGETADATVVSVDCVSHGIMIHLEDGLTRKSMRRTLRQTPSVHGDRERLLALAVAEFILASWVELSLAQPEGLQPMAARAPPQVVEAARRTAAAVLPTAADPDELSSPSPSAVHLGTALIWRNAVGRLGPSALGVGLMVNWRVLGSFHIEVEGHALFGEASVQEGTIAHRTVGGDLHARYDLPLGTKGHFGLGAGMTMAAFTTIATPQNGARHHASRNRDISGGPYISSQFAMDLGRSSRMALRATVGLVTLPVELTLDQDGSPILEASGAWLGVSVRASTGL